MAELKGIFFDMDGVIIDTERDGHRVAFNEAFREFGVDIEWDTDCYKELVKVSGGKERMRHFFRQRNLFPGMSAEEETDLIARLHKRKTEIFVSLIKSRMLPLRPGVRRFMLEAQDMGLTMCVCTTANERSADAVARGVLEEINFAHILAGDVVSKKKPDPEIYHLALAKTGLAPENVLVVEDSRNGLLAACAAGIPVLATTNPYTEDDDLSEAEIVVTCLGDADGETGALTRANNAVEYDGVLSVEALMQYFR